MAGTPAAHFTLSNTTQLSRHSYNPRVCINTVLAAPVMSISTAMYLRPSSEDRQGGNCAYSPREHNLEYPCSKASRHK